jgi:hypothetical protein
MPTRGRVFGRDETFEQAFPGLAEAVVRVRDVETGETLFYQAATLGETIRYCSNPDCDGRGFSIGTVLREMVKTGQTTRGEDQRMCRGWDRAARRMCLWSFSFTVSLTYKTE